MAFVWNLYLACGLMAMTNKLLEVGKAYVKFGSGTGDRYSYEFLYELLFIR
jgi:hypothetical protein